VNRGARNARHTVAMSRNRIIAALGVVALLAVAAGTALAAGSGPTQISVQTVPSITAGQKAPFDAPGVRAIRRDKAVPKGYVLVGQKVTIDRGAKTAGAALRVVCPGTKRLRTFGVVGDAGFFAPRDYVRHRETQIMSFPPPAKDHASGTVYAVCR
jgi:hypothetical protein